MFQRSEIEACFTSLVGWRPSSLQPACFPNFTTELLTSDSGLFVNDYPGIDGNFINEILSKDKVSLNEYLENVHTSCATELINDFLILQRKNLNTKALLSNFDIGTKLADIRKTQAKRSRFVGFLIKPFESNSVRVDLDQIGVQFDALQLASPNDLEIYFYASSQKTAITTFSINDVNHTKESSLQWFDISGFIAEYISENYASGDTYYIGYYEDDLNGNAIETFLSCTTCSNAPRRKWGEHMHISPIEVASGDTYVSREIFDVESVGETNATHGLHLKVNVTCDVSEVICQNKQLFANALQKKIAIRLYWEAFNSDRINQVTFINKEDAQLMAEKTEMDYTEELQALSVDFTHIDTRCLPCKRRSLGRVNLR